MSPERWKQVDELFQEAADLPPHRRVAFLNERCGGDAQLRMEIESLLNADTVGVSFDSLVEGAVGSLAANDVEYSASPIGQRVGPYKLVRELGRGGMGSVYQAVRVDDQYLQAVAIKLVARGAETESTLQRFRIERQILATLQHPNIAALLDGGSTPGGSPYIVMEYIEGRPVTDYCREYELNINNRLELFRHICAAVHYAHQKLVIHRDIKPANILVTNEGQPKLLDFGIAKLLAPELIPGGEVRTVTGVLLMTPQYASPEQVRGEELTTASDVYSLGVVLYELLSGNSPYRSLTSGSSELISQVCDSPPVPLPERAADPKLRRALSGDLENIVAMALRKEPTRRYASVQQLSDDVDRYLKGLPIGARKDTILYRAGKLVRRNRLATAAFALLTISIAAGMVATVREARRTEARYRELRALANTVLFDFHAKIQHLPGSIPARELLVRTALRYLNQLSEDAAGDESLAWELSQAYEQVGDVQGDPDGPNLGQVDAALASYRRSRALVEGVRLHRADWQTLSCLAWLYYKIGDLEMRIESPERGLKSFRQGLKVATEVRERLPSAGWAELELNGHERLAQGLVRSGGIKEAIRHARLAGDAAEEAAKRRPGARALAFRARAANLLAGLLWLSGDMDGAWSTLQSAIATYEKLSAGDPKSAATQRELMDVYRRAGDFQANPSYFHFGDTAASLSFYRKAIAIAETLAVRDQENAQARADLGVTRRRMASVLAETDPAQSAALYRQAIAALEDRYIGAPGDLSALRDLANTRLGYARPLANLKQLDDALTSLHAALAAQEEILIKDPGRTVVREDMLETRVMLGRIETSRNNLPEARRHLDEAVALAAGMDGAAGTANLYAERCRALAARAMGQHLAATARSGVNRQANLDQARSYFERALAVWTSWKSRKIAVVHAEREERAVRRELDALRR